MADASPRGGGGGASPRSPRGDASPRAGDGSPRSPRALEDGEGSSPRSPGRSPRSPGQGGGGGGKRKGGDIEDMKGACRCPQCSCCATFFPCLYCFHPDQVLKQDKLIQEMMAINKSRHINMSLVEDLVKQDRQRRMGIKAKWRRRWVLCCCCSWVLALAGSAALVVYFAFGTWTVKCFGDVEGDTCGWSPRKHFGAVYTPEKEVIVVGGTDGETNLGDVWGGPAEGGEFKLLNAAAPFGPRHGHALLCRSPGDGRLFVLGGDSAGVGGAQPTPLSDVWSSKKGVDWTLQTAEAPWVGRKFLGATIGEEGRLFVAGGSDGVGIGGLNDVWRSDDDGRTWSVVTFAAPWSGRHSHAFAALPAGAGSAPWRLYLFGGDDGIRQHDVWASDDGGGIWTLMEFTHTREMRYNAFEHRAPWTPRSSFGAVVDSSGRMFVLGGRTDGVEEDPLSNQVWSLPAPQALNVEWWQGKSKDPRLNERFDPIAWSQESTPTWPARSGHQAILDADGVAFVIGGETENGLVSDMWKFEMSVDLNNLRAVL